MWASLRGALDLARTAHEFTPEEVREAGRKGGEAVSRDREHMSEIGQKGGEHSHGGQSQSSDRDERRAELIQQVPPEGVGPISEKIDEAMFLVLREAKVRPELAEWDTVADEYRRQTRARPLVGRLGRWWMGGRKSVCDPGWVSEPRALQPPQPRGRSRGAP